MRLQEKNILKRPGAKDILKTELSFISRGKDIDFASKKINVRSGKGEKDRVTMLPEIVINPLQKHLPEVKKQHHKDLNAGFGTVYLPYALAKKYPNANRQWGWQFTP